MEQERTKRSQKCIANMETAVLEEIASRQFESLYLLFVHFLMGASTDRGWIIHQATQECERRANVASDEAKEATEQKGGCG